MVVCARITVETNYIVLIIVEFVLTANLSIMTIRVRCEASEVPPKTRIALQHHLPSHELFSRYTRLEAQVSNMVG